jgi:murein DD-endopeptidase MepM/ murein hydrolase activator NlpD
MHRIDEPLWSGNFLRPINAPATPSFGTKRVFNGKVNSIHRGTDFPAKVGTPVVASNAGQVVLARKLFYEGNCVIVDHGQQFLTMYMHLSKIEVEEGSTVRKGERLGLSGATGRVTGPHLHMAVRWESAYIDPTKLLALTLPVVHGDKPSNVKAKMAR